MKEANVITANFLRVNQAEVNVTGRPCRNPGGSRPAPQEPDAWLWGDGDRVLWEDGTEMLLEEVQQD